MAIFFFKQNIQYTSNILYIIKIFPKEFQNNSLFFHRQIYSDLEKYLFLLCFLLCKRYFPWLSKGTATVGVQQCSANQTSALVQSPALTWALAGQGQCAQPPLHSWPGHMDAMDLGSLLLLTRSPTHPSPQRN